ncbi:MAG: YchJ family metal-binding protein [bacterium]|nr:YchJ family metal-binding protein [bacterium]
MSELSYDTCCGPYHEGSNKPDSPEALMRSRYSAYTMAMVDYIENTMSGPALSHFNTVEAKTWASSVTWLGLRILRAPKAKQNSGTVEFTAYYSQNKIPHTLHEISEFRKENGEWKYVTGKILQS